MAKKVDRPKFITVQTISPKEIESFKINMAKDIEKLIANSTETDDPNKSYDALENTITSNHAKNFPKK